MKEARFFSTSVGTPFGPWLLVAQGPDIVAFGPHESPNWEASESLPLSPVLQQASAQIAEYFAGRRHTFEVPLRFLRGTDFQQRAWRSLMGIPFGHTWTYQQQALSLLQPRATRAVGSANGRNPLWILVPCHRVVAASGALGGYAGGAAMKNWLLEHERRHR